MNQTGETLQELIQEWVKERGMSDPNPPTLSQFILTARIQQAVLEEGLEHLTLVNLIWALDINTEFMFGSSIPAGKVVRAVILDEYLRRAKNMTAHDLVHGTPEGVRFKFLFPGNVLNMFVDATKDKRLGEHMVTLRYRMMDMLASKITRDEHGKMHPFEILHSALLNLVQFHAHADSPGLSDPEMDLEALKALLVRLNIRDIYDEVAPNHRLRYLVR